MRLRRTRWTSTLWVLLAVVAGGGAARAEGPGIRLGDRLVLHLGLGAEIRYDSNVFFQSSNTTGSFLLGVLPSIDLATRPPIRGGSQPHTIDFRFHAGMRYNEFLTSNDAVRQHRSFALDLGILTTLFPYYALSVDLYDNYARTTQPPYTEVPFNLDRDTNDLGVRFRYAPGGRRLELQLSYTFGIDFFEVQQLRDFDLYAHKLNLRASWRFYPKTAVYINASETIYQYPHHGNFSHSDSYPFHVELGVIGLVTVKLAVNLWVGYGNGFYVSGPSPNTAVGGLDLRWRPSIFSSGTLGYRHDFANSLLGSFYDIDSVYAAWVQQIWRFSASARLGYQNQRFQGIPPTQAVPSTTRTDNYISFDARVDYPFKDWLIASLGYDLQWNTSNEPLNLGVAGIVPVDYTKNEVYLRLSVLY
jgi:hypothetical protein